MKWALRGKVDGKKKVQGYCDQCLIKPTRTFISEKRRLAIVAALPKRSKEIHAFIEGELLSTNEPMDTSSLVEMSYNPYYAGYWYTSKDKQPIDPMQFTYLYFDSNTRKCYGIK